MVKQIVVKLESPSIGRIITKLKGVSNKKNKEYASPISSRLGASHLLNLHYILKPAAPLIYFLRQLIGSRSHASQCTTGRGREINGVRFIGKLRVNHDRVIVCVGKHGTSRAVTLAYGKKLLRTHIAFWSSCTSF